MINKTNTKIIRLYGSTAVKKALEKAAKQHKTKVSPLGCEILSSWLVKHGYLKTIRVRIVE